MCVCVCVCVTQIKTMYSVEKKFPSFFVEIFYSYTVYTDK